MAANNIGARTTNQRTNMFAMLKKQNMQKRSQNLTLEKVKETFQATDWNESKAKPTSKEVEEIEDADDSDFDEDKALEEQKRQSTEMWDDEENVIQEEAPMAEEEGEDEISLHEAPDVMSEQASEKASVKPDDPMDQDSDNSEIRTRQRRVKTVNS